MEKGQVSGSNIIRPCDHPGLSWKQAQFLAVMSCDQPELECYKLTIPGMEAGPV